MADTIREQILKALQTRLGENCLRSPTIADFYNNDVPIIGLVDGDETSEKFYDNTRNIMTVTVEKIIYDE